MRRNIALYKILLSKKRDKFIKGYSFLICMNTESLHKIGLSETEIKIYLALLKLGKANVTQLAEESSVHRTNIYSVLDKLKEMGLVSYFREDNKTKFKITDPKNLLNYLKENEEAIRELLPDLKKIQESIIEKIEVEIFRGDRGMKSAFKDIIRIGKDVVGFGMAGQLRKYLPIFAGQWIRDIKANKIKNKYIYIEGTELIEEGFEVRILPKNFTTPVATQIYGDKILISIWEPTLIAIMIKSKEVADNYRKHFELLWRLATK